MNWRPRPLLNALLSLLVALPVAAALPAPPETPRRPVTDEYQGVRVEDNYRWLEDSSDPAVRAWSDAQNRYARTFLDGLPERQKLYKRLQELLSTPSPDYRNLEYKDGKLFALLTQPPKEQPLLIALTSADAPATARSIIDPNTLNTGGTTAIDFFVPSRDGRLVAVSLSQNGSEDGTLHVYETETGKELPDRIPRAQYPTGGGSVAWNSDSTGFWYTRYPQGDERPKEDVNFYQQIYFHKLGTPASADTYALGKAFPRIAETALTTSDDGRYVLASVANGDGGEFAHYLLGPSGDWQQVSRFEEQVVQAAIGRDGGLWLLSHKDAPTGRVLRVPLDKPQLAGAQAVIPASEAVIERVVPTAGRLYTLDLLGGPSQVRTFDLSGKFIAKLPLPPVSAVDQVVPTGGDELLLRNQSFTRPPAWYRYRPQTNLLVRTALVKTSPASFNDIEVVREFATSKDGTKVPVNILRRKGTPLDGNNPAILYGYGGYAISLRPNFDASRRVWFDRGGIYVVANLRGGGEYGEEWHQAGNLTRKQNVFDDFYAAARYLVTSRYTQPFRLAIRGGSNGGLLMGAALTQHPELFRAVISSVGIYDMLRVERDPNGAFNVTEFGSVKDPEQFKALYAYSPYHHVVDSSAYPAALFLTGDNDGRVNPANSRKMTARLQAASGSGYPVLLRTSASSGHGQGTALSEQIAQQADIYAFLFDQLYITPKPVPIVRPPAKP
ncbi:prolyl oligopeptidase family serine peptidase [Gloeobacter kilaueensis]|uniref:prolyl oligopeptidase family serine peptidase n=1 Tax=Gloeobacter kilaueensis TaxID=1416614 RepID=UPI001CB6E79F|nr:prolyl oligopeptidase family serine peptidase [Gloeobacter kilaueensis]